MIALAFMTSPSLELSSPTSSSEVIVVEGT